MTSSDIILGVLFLFQTAFGALGNSFLLGLYSITFFIDPRLRIIHFLLSNLTLANDLVLLSKGIPQIMAAFGFNNFLDDIGCKLVFYLHRVARGLSLCTTCLLSTFQAITLSSRSSRWADLKARGLKSIVSICFWCWTLNLVAHYLTLLYIKSPNRTKNITERNDFIYCSLKTDVPLNATLYIFTISFPDVFCVAILIGTSGYMVFVLCRHHQRVKYIHHNTITPTSSPETKATQTILLLVSMFVSFYSLNAILTLYIYLGKVTFWLVHTSAFLAACFPACSPFVLIVSDSEILKYSLAFWKRIKLLVK
ncbi:vomeronasal type-1 receptor 4-like [Dromiciops gliroides]|uniref:vomeronasal type-1 receptor 4-like n=1 Tax=Dromiciops gliroides TaxID=33562 RepID=UPI001CC4CCD7|nr:vomeronasal type-1 receptor 4-like [Dromiciops gliroides]